MNPNEEKLKELQAEIEAKKAEIAEIKASEQKAKAEEMATPQPTAEQMALLSGIGLQGNRGADGSLVTEEPEVAKPSIQEIVDGLKLIGLPTDGLDREFSDGFVKAKKILNDASQTLGSREELIRSKEFQEAFGTAYDKLAAPLGPIEIDLDEQIDEAADKKIKETFHDIDGNYRDDEVSEKMRNAGIDAEQGRTRGKVDDTPMRSMGFKDNGGIMSVDEKDDFWKTQEGLNKAMEMYGMKPAWIPDEPTMVWNPVEQKYEEIKDEDKDDFVDFSQPRISSDLKALLG